MGPTACKTKLHCELDLSGRSGSGRKPELEVVAARICEFGPQIHPWSTTDRNRCANVPTI